MPHFVQKPSSPACPLIEFYPVVASVRSRFSQSQCLPLAEPNDDAGHIWKPHPILGRVSSPQGCHIGFDRCDDSLLSLGCDRFERAGAAQWAASRREWMWLQLGF